jgi:DNA-binding MarR family transcriptional regulator
MIEQPFYTSECHVYLLAKAFQKGHGLVQRRLRPYGLTNIQYVVLELLWQNEGLTAGEISTLVKIDKATLSGVLERMAESDWIIREGDKSDRRVFRLYPSGKANRAKEQLIQERKDANEELLAGFTAEERVLLRRLLLALL